MEPGEDRREAMCKIYVPSLDKTYVVKVSQSLEQLVLPIGQGIFYQCGYFLITKYVSKYCVKSM